MVCGDSGLLIKLYRLFFLTFMSNEDGKIKDYFTFHIVTYISFFVMVCRDNFNFYALRQTYINYVSFKEAL